MHTIGAQDKFFGRMARLKSVQECEETIQDLSHSYVELVRLRPTTTHTVILTFLQLVEKGAFPQNLGQY